MTTTGSGAAERELRELLARSESLGDQLRNLAAELTGYVTDLSARVEQEDGGGLHA